MRLLSKTQTYYLSLLLVLLLVWSGIFLYAISMVFRDSIDETLQSELQSTIVQFQQQDEESLLNYAQNSPLFDFIYIDSIRTRGAFYSDTMFYNSVEKEEVPYRQIQAEIKSAGKPVRITLSKSLVEYEDLFFTILVTECIFVIVLIAGMVVLNQGVLQKVWSPFFLTLEKISSYRIGKNKALELPDTNILEFEELNHVLKEMTHKMEQDYESLKQFTENASHEIQTPLAVIISRIEVMLQENELGEEGWESLKEIYEAAGRLSRLNKALLLLTKIENRQFSNTETVEIGKLIERLLPEYEEQITQKKITVSSEIEKGVQVKANQELMQVLVRNLISNAIRHNIKEGDLAIELHFDQFIISNSGSNDESNLEKYFDRFYKKSKNPNSLGLGLAIVKEICELNGFSYTYTMEDKKHVVRIDFNFSVTEQ